MKYIFPILAMTWGLASTLPGQEPTSPEMGDRALSEVGETRGEFTGRQLIELAADELLEHVTLQARVRQRVFLFGQRLTGTGQFYQAQARDRIVCRLDFRLPQGRNMLVVQQINDGDYLWIQRDVGKKGSLGRVDLRRVRNSDIGRSLPPAQELALGGISQLLFGLNRHFDFQTPRAAMLGDVPVWVLHGTWRTGGGAGEGATSSSLDMPHVPDSVVLVLSRTESLPLFPFRVEFARHQTAHGGARERTPIMAVDFFEVRVGVDLDSRLFTYTVGDRDLSDDTERFLLELRGGE
jgi:hypothetical protein